MNEALIINRILQTMSTKILEEYDVKEYHFLIKRAEISFILNHLSTYNQVPSIPVFIMEFADFEIQPVNESDEYLVYKLKEAYLFKDSVPILKETEKLIKEDSFKAIQFLKENVEKLIREHEMKVGRGVDIIRDSDQRLQTYIERQSSDGVVGISTGIKMLDDLLFGWQKEDLVVLFARTNKGKSWLLLYFLTVAWSLGYKVVMYSGEMSPTLVGYRMDTFYKHYSNRALLSGMETLGNENDSRTEYTSDDYKEYIADLSTKDGFIVLTPKDFDGKPTVNQLKKQFIYHNGDILGVDQITLMTDQRKGENKRLQYTNISEDLYLMSEELQKPVLAVTQANRDSAKKGSEDAPELHEISESDGISHNSTRTLAMNVIDNVLKIHVRKNRYGLNEREILMLWDIDKGVIKPLLESENQSNEYGF